MKRLIIALVLATTLLAVTWLPVQAREEEGFGRTKYPAWATQTCIETIYKIVSHEAGNTNDDEIFQFMTEQIVRDISKYGCDGLTQWRWRIGVYPLEKINNQVRASVHTVIENLPKMNFPRCKFIGMKTDIPTWASYGYNTEIGFQKTLNNLTVVGVDCDYIYATNQH